jgi:hypothetical protein
MAAATIAADRRFLVIEIIYSGFLLLLPGVGLLREVRRGGQRTGRMVVLGPRRGRAWETGRHTAGAPVGVPVAVAVGCLCGRAGRVILARVAVRMSRTLLGTLLFGNLADAFADALGP